MVHYKVILSGATCWAANTVTTNHQLLENKPRGKQRSGQGFGMSDPPVHHEVVHNLPTKEICGSQWECRRASIIRPIVITDIVDNGSNSSSQIHKMTQLP